MKYDQIVEGMDNNSVRALCHLLLLKRSVDGLNGRDWKATEHLDYEDSIVESLPHLTTLNATTEGEL